MSTITLKNNAVINKKAGNMLMDRIMDYFTRNQNTITLGLYTVSGRVPDVGVLRAMKVLK